MLFNDISNYNTCNRPVATEVRFGNLLGSLFENQLENLDRPRGFDTIFLNSSLYFTR